MRKRSYITVTDQFCGAGGSSLGARKAIEHHGGKIALALNHWKLAVETHNTNFPDTLHECTDISASEPRRYPSTDILITSPECTNHSIAKGQKSVKAQLDLFNKLVIDPSCERSRATTWDVLRFAEVHKYNIIIVENVVDARKWVQFPAWLLAMNLLGYNHKAVYLNSMHCHPTPQSRDRMYIIFWKKGNKAPDLEVKPKAYCPQCGHDIEALQSWKDSTKNFGKYRQQYVYRCPTHGIIVEPYYYAAFNAIDWSDIGKSIGDRKKPLSENTIRRIEYGLKKYGAKPFQVINYSPGYSKGLDSPVQTCTTNDHHALCTPFIIKGEHTLNQGYVKSVEEVFQTQTVRQSMALVIPFIIENKGQSKSKGITDPFGTQTTIPHLGLLNAFIHSHYGSTTLSHVSQGLGTVTTKDRHSIVSYAEPRIEDCYYRMLKPHEIQAAMAFDPDYKILGSGKDKVKQLGNAVTPPAMELLVSRCVESLM